MPMKRADLQGMRFGRLIVNGWDPESKKWKCSCDCGKTTKVPSNKLTTGHTTSCGCARTGHDKKRLKDITGQRFGMLVAIEHIGYSERGQAIWRFKCDCGNTYEAVSYPVVFGSVISCGCYNRRQTAERNTRHGFSKRGEKEKLYQVWNAMKSRCGNPNNSHYYRYGGRGIKVCAEWSDYAPFRKWAYENGYDEGLTIDRINNDGDYCPENCRFITMDEQMRNTSRNVFVEYKGERMTISELSRKCGVKYGTLYRRLKSGYSVEEAVEGRKVG